MTREEKIKTLRDYCNKHTFCSNGCRLCRNGYCLHSCDWGGLSDFGLDECLYMIDVNNIKEQTVNSTDVNPDMVSHPPHYNQGGIECIDAIKSAVISKTGIEAVCVANVIKYIWRYEAKNGLEDVKKAQFYLNRLIKELEDKSK